MFHRTDFARYLCKFKRQPKKKSSIFLFFLPQIIKNNCNINKENESICKEFVKKKPARISARDLGNCFFCVSGECFD